MTLTAQDCKDGQMRVRLSNARVEHSDHHVRILSVIHDQLLSLLNHAKARVVDCVREVEEEIDLGRNLNSNELGIAVAAAQNHFSSDGLYVTRTALLDIVIKQ